VSIMWNIQLFQMCRSDPTVVLLMRHNPNMMAAQFSLQQASIKRIGANMHLTYTANALMQHRMHNKPGPGFLV